MYFLNLRPPKKLVAFLIKKMTTQNLGEVVIIKKKGEIIISI